MLVPLSDIVSNASRYKNDTFSMTNGDMHTHEAHREIIESEEVERLRKIIFRYRFAVVMCAIACTMCMTTDEKTTSFAVLQHEIAHLGLAFSRSVFAFVREVVLDYPVQNIYR